jgi:hypothetical protein
MENYCTFSGQGETLGFSNNSLATPDLSFPDNAKLISEAIAFLQEINTFVRPLSIDLDLSCLGKNWQESSQLPSPRAFWSLQSSKNSTHAILDSCLPNPQISTIQEITLPAISEWISSALNQPEFHSDSHFLTWTSITLSAMEVKIPDEEEFKNCQSMTLQGQCRLIDLPLTHRKDGIWVATPTSALRQAIEESPFDITLMHSYGYLDVTILVNWSAWTHHSQGRAMIKDAVERIIGRGWTIRHLSSTFSKLIQGENPTNH